MSPLSDKFFRERVNSLDSVSPPTNWNPENTWNRIGKIRPWHRRPLVRLGMAAMLVLLLAIVLWPNNTTEPSNQYVTTTTKAPILPKKSTPAIDTLTNTDQVLAKNSEPPIATAPPTQKTVQEPQILVKEKPFQVVQASASTFDSLPPSPLIDSNLQEKVNIASIDTTAIKTENAPPEKKEFGSPKITISLHANKVKEKPVRVQRSIIKLKNDYRYHTNKKVYTVQIK